MKLKIKALLAIATAFGYAGTDPAEAKAYLVKQNREIDGPTGKVKAADLEWEAEAPTVETKAVSITADMLAGSPAAPAPAPSPAPAPFDIEAYTKAVTESVLKATGSLQTERKAIAPVEIKVKTGGERFYDMKVAAGQNAFKSFENARGFAYWLGAKIKASQNDHVGFLEYDKKFRDWHDIHAKAYATTSPTSGAAIVPEVFQPDLIKNVLEYGVARRLGRITPMGSDRVVLPRRTGGLSGSYPLENNAPTASQATYDNVTLTAHTFAVNAQASNEILQDSGIPFVDETMQEIALCIATQEDNMFFIGNGSSTYAGVVGFEYKYGTTATDGGYVVVGGGDAQAHTHANIVSAIGRVPQYARRSMVITCSPTLKSEIFDRLATSSNTGGLTLDEVTGFGLVSKYLGVPIIENNSMSSVIVASTTNRPGFTAGDQIDFLIGDFSRAARFGTRLDMEIAVDTSIGFKEYCTWFRGIVRHDVNVHSVGDSTTAGPVVAFMQT